MIHPSDLEEAAAFVRGQWPSARPAAGMILGSGWGDVVESFQVRGTLPYEQIPGLGRTGVVGHSGRLLWAQSAGVETFIFQGRRHYYEGADWTPVAIPPFILKTFGARNVVLTNAAGGIRADLRPGSLLLLRDHINFIGSNPLIGPHCAVWGPRFPDQSAVYSPRLRAAAQRAATAADVELTEGVYLAGSGPVYETPAEIRMYRTLGADAVGMSTVPEAMLCSAGGLEVCGISCITNLASGISLTPLSHEEVTEATRAAMPRMSRLVAKLWMELGGRMP